MEAAVQEIVPEETSLVQITKGEVDMQVSTAKQYPRSVKQSIDDAVGLATIDKRTAESCFFALPRGGTLIEGPSVRLAEIVANTWGNLRCEARVIDEGRTHVTAQATVWDMERNLLVRIESKRRITDKNGNRYNQDMVLMTSNAAVSIALRNAVFRVVPRAIVDRVYNQAREVAFGTAKTMEQRRTAAMGTFSKLGVTEERILSVLERRAVEDITVEDLSTLLGLLNALREGATTVEDAFPEISRDEKPNENGSNGKKSKKKRNGSKTNEVLDRIRESNQEDEQLLFKNGEKEERDQTQDSDQTQPPSKS
jgi:hypothetical protein